MVVLRSAETTKKLRSLCMLIPDKPLKVLPYHIVQWPDSSLIHTNNNKTICIHSFPE